MRRDEPETALPLLWSSTGMRNMLSVGEKMIEVVEVGGWFLSNVDLFRHASLNTSSRLNGLSATGKEQSVTSGQ